MAVAKTLEKVRVEASKRVNASVIFANSQRPETVSLVPQEVDFLFIDADHKYAGVKKDWELYGPLVKHGHVAFHDIHAKPKDDPVKNIEVGRLWNEIRGHELQRNRLKSGNRDSQD
jgi:hypothetical protein